VLSIPPCTLLGSSRSLTTITDYEVEGLRLIWNNRHTTNRMEVTRWKHLTPHFVISEAHSTRITLHTTDMGEPSGDTRDLENQDGPECEIDISSTELNPLLPMSASSTTIPPQSMPSMSSFLPTSSFPVTNPSSSTTQTCLLATHPSGRPMRSVR